MFRGHPGVGRGAHALRYAGPGLLAAGVAIGLLAAGSSAAPNVTGGGRFDHQSWLVKKGKQLFVTGAAPECARGARISLTVKVSQHGHTVAGSVPTWTCSGAGEAFHAQLTGAEALGPGSAVGKATATMTVSGRSRTFRWKGSLVIADYRPPVGDHPEYGTVTFSVGAGVDVVIVGSGPASNCTRNETELRFTTKGNNERHQFGFIAKTSGICNYEESYSNFDVFVGHGGLGHIWLGQYGPGEPYFTSCLYGSASDIERSTARYLWSGVRCGNDRALQITP
jgi:hypothetical protein